MFKYFIGLWGQNKICFLSPQKCRGTQKMSLTINSSGKQPILRFPQLSLLPLRLMPLTQTQWGWKILSRNGKDVPLIPVQRSQNLYAKNWEFRYMIFHFIVSEKKNIMTRYYGIISMTESICVSALLRKAECLISEHVTLWNLFFIFYILSIYLINISLILFLLISFLYFCLHVPMR